jgi:hypothetical protein
MIGNENHVHGRTFVTTFTEWFRKPGDFLIDMREKGLSDGPPEGSLVNPLHTASVSLLLELTAMHNKA